MPKEKQPAQLTAVEARRFEVKKRRRRRVIRSWIKRAIFLALVVGAVYGYRIGRDAYRDYKDRQLTSEYAVVAEEADRKIAPPDYKYDAAIADLTAFAAANPKFNGIDELKKKIEAISKLRDEYSTYIGAIDTKRRRTDRIIDCDKYLLMYPKGPFRDEVSAVRDDLFKKRDEEFYEDLLRRSRTARRLEDSLRIIERYLNESPGSLHKQKALDEIARLNVAIDRRDYEEAVEKAQNALRELRPKTAKTALTDYISQHPDSLRVAKAAEFLDLLEAESVEDEFRTMINDPPEYSVPIIEEKIRVASSDIRMGDFGEARKILAGALASGQLSATDEPYFVTALTYAYIRELEDLRKHQRWRTYYNLAVAATSDPYVGGSRRIQYILREAERENISDKARGLYFGALQLLDTGEAELALDKLSELEKRSAAGQAGYVLSEYYDTELAEVISRVRENVALEKLQIAELYLGIRPEHAYTAFRFAEKLAESIPEESRWKNEILEKIAKLKLAIEDNPDVRIYIEYIALLEAAASPDLLPTDGYSMVVAFMERNRNSPYSVQLEEAKADFDRQVYVEYGAEGNAMVDALREADRGKARPPDDVRVTNAVAQLEEYLLLTRNGVMAAEAISRITELNNELQAREAYKFVRDADLWSGFSVEEKKGFADKYAAAWLAGSGFDANPDNGVRINDRGYAEFRRRCDGMWMVLIPSGTAADSGFHPGKVENRGAASDISVKPFMIDKYEVTNSQYAIFLNKVRPENPRLFIDLDSDYCQIVMKGNSYRPKLRAPDEKGAKIDDLPVVTVTWYGANAYSLWGCRRSWRSFDGKDSSLPTEAMWVKAGGWRPSSPGGAGGIRLKYPWGDDEPDSSKAVFAHGAGGWWSPIDLSGGGAQKILGWKHLASAEYNSHSESKSPYGLFHMSGNVWEWCVNPYEELYSPAVNGVAKDPATLAEGAGARVIRGGGWCVEGSRISIDSRQALNPWNSSVNAGFRTVFLLPEKFIPKSQE